MKTLIMVFSDVENITLKTYHTSIAVNFLFFLANSEFLILKGLRVNE